MLRGRYTHVYDYDMSGQFDLSFTKTTMLSSQTSFVALYLGLTFIGTVQSSSHVRRLLGKTLKDCVASGSDQVCTIANKVHFRYQVITR